MEFASAYANRLQLQAAAKPRRKTVVVRRLVAAVGAAGEALTILLCLLFPLLAELWEAAGR